jgi:filamentous hemagglutinin family protein
MALLLAVPQLARANPNGGVVQGGVATITGQGTSQVDVHQGSQSAVLSWQNFNIAPGEVTNFRQPNANATAINRILQQDPSKIFGALNANGNVYLINPNGFLFGASATVNTRGFSASTSADDLMKLSGYDASATAAAGAKIENHGKISAGDGGFVYLIAPRIENGRDAVITTPKGEVLLAAGATVTLTDDPSGTGLGVKYTAPGQTGGEAVNLGKLVANGGFAKMRADMVRQGGVVQANAVREQNGKIELYATRDLQLEAGSVTAATGGEGEGAGGNVFAYSEGSATMHDGAVVDVSGGAEGGDGGRAELSAKNEVALDGGTFRASAKAGSKRGSVEIDPATLTISASTSFVGAGDVVAEADEKIQVSSGAVVSLSNDALYGDGSADRQSFTLRSGRHISFGSGSKIVDDGTGASGQKVWDVNLVAGADLASSNLLATKSDSNGGVYLSGASFDSAGEVTRFLGNDGEVALTHGDLTVRAPGDLIIGNGGGLKNQTGAIDVAVGRDVRFRAGSETEDGVIENGSGDIAITAGRDVLLVENVNTRGNAAIRTRGVLRTDSQGQTTVTDGGSIVIQAGRDVDAGVGNRWLEPGPNLSPEGYLGFAEELGLPSDFVPPDFDPLPVVRNGILGIGTEAGGDVTIVAGHTVRTGLSTASRNGSTASGLLAQSNGSHIGVFGRPVTRVPDPVFGNERNVSIEGAPDGRVTVVAGDSIEGDYIIRNGDAVFRAGYELKPGVSARTLDVADLDAGLVEAAAVALDRRVGWFGTLARPVTVDSIEASVFGLGLNGVALRGIENPSMVYPPNANSDVGGTNGIYAVPSWRPGDSAALRSKYGDVILLGNDTDLPPVANGAPPPGDLVRLLPPNVRIETDRGDLVLLNDFLVYPSTNGGLDLQIAGKVRTAGLSASTSAVLSLVVESLGGTGNVTFTVPVGTKLRDPVTGIEYTVTSEVTVRERLPAQEARGNVVFQVSSEAAGGEVEVPAGTRVLTSDGRIYKVQQDQFLLAPSTRLSQGKVTFFASAGGAAETILINSGTILTSVDGTRFKVADSGTLLPGQTQLTLPVVALDPGVDVPALSLSLETSIAGIDRAINLDPTTRPTEIRAFVIAEEPGAAGTVRLPFEVTALVDPVAGIESVTNSQQIAGGADIAPTGVGSGPSNTAPLVRADVLGPGAQLPTGTRLVFVDPSVLPAGVDPNEVSILVGEVAIPATVAPAVNRELRPDSTGTLRPDPEPGSVAIVSPTEAWIRRGTGISATIKQSDADPDIDQRNISGAFSYNDYFSLCRSGVECSIGTFGTGPTHASDPSRSILRALGGFERVTLDLAKPAYALTGDPGNDGLFGTPDDGVDGSIVDFGLITQHTKASDETAIWVPIGNASFGADAPAPGVDPDLLSGLQVAGPGSAKLLVGVLPNSPQVDTNANGKLDPDESSGDRNGDGGVDSSEWRGSSAVFTHIDESQREYLPAGSSAIFSNRGLIPPGGGNGVVTAAESPYVPSGRGGQIRLAAAVPESEAPFSLGINAIGNARNTTLPTASAALFVAADGDIDLNGRGSIETYQGSRLVVESVSGGVRGGSPPVDATGSPFTGRRGIVTLFRPPGFGDAPASESGGGAIGVDTQEDVDVGGLALASLSGSDITIYSRDGSIDAGVSSPFSNPIVFVSGSGAVLVNYEGGGIFAKGGNIGLFAKQDIKIGAGISGAGITIDAGGSLVGGGAGGIAGTNVNIDVGGSISGSISATGSINVAGGSVAQGASLSAGGLVAGAGAGIGSNSGGNKASSELASLSGTASETAAAGFQTAHAVATGERQVMIQVTSRVIGEPEEAKKP